VPGEAFDALNPRENNEPLFPIRGDAPPAPESGAPELDLGIQLPIDTPILSRTGDPLVLALSDGFPNFGRAARAALEGVLRA